MPYVAVGLEAFGLLPGEVLGVLGVPQRDTFQKKNLIYPLLGVLGVRQWQAFLFFSGNSLLLG